MGLGRDQTRDPWICSQTRICCQAHYRLRYAARYRGLPPCLIQYFCCLFSCLLMFLGSLYSKTCLKQPLKNRHRALDHPILGQIFGPIPNVCFFPIPDKKFPILPKKSFFCSPSLFHHRVTYYYIITILQNNRIQSHLLLSLPFLIVH